jgi:phosphoribosylanthranilate isomerase
MQPTLNPRVKICCIQSIEEAQLAIHYGASAIGLVSEMPSGPGPIPESLIIRIAKTIPPSISSFLLTSKQNTQAIIKQQKRTKVNTIQICDRITNGRYEDLKEAMPGIAIVQVIHVTGEESITEALEVAPHVNGILLDSGNQSLPIKILGGTGRTHNWDISKKIRELVNVPIFLAGGLNPDNILEAINHVQPFGVDVCSGVRINSELDEEKLSKFFNKINSLTFIK